MSWLRSPLRESFRGRSNNQPMNTAKIECDPKACFDSFRKHWQQAYDVIQKGPKVPTHDDILGVVQLLDHMHSLLLVELHNCNKLRLHQQNVNSPCLEYTLSENVLDKLYEWSVLTGRYSNAVRLELLKLFEHLVSHSRHQLLVHEPFLRPLLKLLGSSQDEIYPPDCEKRLVILLNQLCVLLMQNVDLLDLFFFSTSQHQGHGKANFIIFSLLIPFVHREGSIGHQARDALLLCMSLSQKNSNIGEYIAYHSSMCPLVVTGLGGLYSLLPNVLDICTPDWHRITPDDVGDIHELTLFMNSLEFINAVAQVAHTLICQQLLDFMYQGFLIPVLGSTLMQIFKSSNFQTNVDSQISAMAYLDLILRSITEPGLMQVFIKFLLDDNKFDGQRMLDILVDRLNTQDSRLCVVSLALFETLLSLNNEEILAELILKHIHRCHHVPLAHKRKINDVEPYTAASDYFLKLTPEVMRGSVDDVNNQSKTIWYVNGASSSDSLYSNYHAYLFDAHHKIAACKKICDQWTNKYRYHKITSPSTTHATTNNNNNNNNNSQRRVTSNEQILKVQMLKQLLEDLETDLISPESSEKGKLHDSLQSIGESSGYESFRYRPEEDDCEVIEETIREPWKISSRKNEEEDIDLSEDLFVKGSVQLGPFIGAVWGKLQTFTSNSVFVNLHLTGLISRLARYPISVLHTILLRPDIPTTSEVPSFQQVLKILKQQIDAELPMTETSIEYVEVARSYLIERENRLTNTRKNAIEANKNPKLQNSGLTQSSSYDPFQRNDQKRRSFSRITNIFRKNPSGNQNNNNNNQMERRDSTEPTSLDSTSSPFSSLTITLGSPTISTTSSGTASTASERDQNLAICAVLLDEWLKELAAISQEQYVVMHATDVDEQLL